MAFSTSGPGRYGLSGEINVTPLIDVLLVLLIIFMVIVPAMPHGLETALPSPKASSVAVMQPVLVRVEQGTGGVTYWLDGRSVAKAELRPRLAQLLTQRSERIVVVKGDGALGFETVSNVIDVAYTDGAGNVELITPSLARQ